MSEHVYQSKSAYVKALILGYMYDKERVTRKEVVDVIKNSEIGKDISDGVIAGGFKMLVASGDIIPVDRGVYMRGNSFGNKDGTVLDRITKLCNKFYADLNKACTYNVLSLSRAEKEIYGEFNDCLDNLVTEVRNNVDYLNNLIKVIELTESTDEGTSEGERTSEGEFAGIAGFDSLEDDLDETEDEIPDDDIRMMCLALSAPEGSFPDEEQSEQNKEQQEQNEEQQEQNEEQQVQNEEQVEEQEGVDKKEKHSSKRKSRK